MHASRGSNWKLWVLIIVLVIALLALAFLLVRYFLPASLFSGRDSGGPVAVGTTEIAIQDANGRDVTDSIALSRGTVQPEEVDPEAPLVLLNIDWNSKKDASYPLIVTVKDPAFTNNDGLAVYHYNGTGWDLEGTYLIVDNAVSFRADSLSPFAFEVISSTPKPTDTPEPTATPEPTETPEPTATPHVIDYGTYSTIQAGTFEQADVLEKDASYVIAIVDDPTAAANGGVTFFDTGAAQAPIVAHVLINYDGKDMRMADLKVSKGAGGRYAIMDPVGSGMLWKAEDSDRFGGTTRYALGNNGKRLNMDDKDENVVMDENTVRTRWLYEKVKAKDQNGAEQEFMTLTYRENTYDTYYISGMSYNAAEQKMEFTATKDVNKALHLVIFRQLQLAAGQYFTGTVVLTGTPDALAGLDATPNPSSTPSATVNPIFNPVTSTNTPAPTQPPTAVTPTAAPTAPPEYTTPPDPTNPPVNTTPATSSDAGTTTTPPPSDPSTDSDT